VTGLAHEQAEWAHAKDIHAGLIEPHSVSRTCCPKCLSGNDGAVLQRQRQVGQIESRHTGPTEGRPLILLSAGADLAHERILAGLQGWGYSPGKDIESSPWQV